MKDIFGNTLRPGDYFTYTTTQKYTHVRIGRMSACGDSYKIIVDAWWRLDRWMALNGRPNETVLVLDASTIPEKVKALLA